MDAASPNFAYLDAHDPLLVRLASLAERYFADDPNTCLIKLRQFAEALCKQAAAYVGEYSSREDGFLDLLNRLWDRGVLTPETSDLFHGLRKAGNAAAHGHTGTHSEALHQLKMARALAVWFHQSFGPDRTFKAPPFVHPPDPRREEREREAELDRLRAELANVNATAAAAKLAAEAEARRRAEAEAAADQSAADVAVWQTLAEETEGQLAAERDRFNVELAAVQAQAIAAPADVTERVTRAHYQGSNLDLTEADTRRLIDEQLRAAGWEADSETLSYKRGARPQPGRNLAVAEWPTESGPADYVLFAGLTALAVVEAKRKSRDIPGSVEQAKRYSRGFAFKGEEKAAGGPWGEFRVPFLFATNGRRYLKQLETASGIWFLDARRPTNHPRALDGWYTPDGLLALLAQDEDAAIRALTTSSPEYLKLRYYQTEAILAAESAIAEGRRNVLLAMATGTGKTRTAIGLIYRLVKAKRFRRVLFLVDRTALGEQAHNAFKDVPLEALKPFTGIYDVKGLGDIVPDSDTRLHIATIQGMIKRLLDTSGGGDTLPVDQYDCIVVDECHRGYGLDREMSDAELTFRSEADYISRYRRVVEHFDAVRIGLTATPALHTTEIFGAPIYEYGYRQAVIDGFLVDFEPPINIKTKLAKDGIHWEAGAEVEIYIPKEDRIETATTPDEVDIDIDSFNRVVVTENFNRAVSSVLAREIDPSLPGKTIVFCLTDQHADIVVKVLKEALDAQYGEVDDAAVVKITGSADKPMELIRRFKNERLPSIAVTVDLLTTGIDVPEVTNLVFIRRVRSRILYEQMLGRATRLCPEIGKESFRVFDAVQLFKALEPHSAMKPVVANPSFTFTQLVDELDALEDDEARRGVLDQIVAKLQRKKRVLEDERREEYDLRSDLGPDELIRRLRGSDPAEAAEWFVAHRNLVTFLDEVTGLPPRQYVSKHEDEVIEVSRGYGEHERPEDYLESFGAFIAEMKNELPALMVVTQRPRDLTRQQLKELKLELDKAGYSEEAIKAAYRETTNQEIAASIVGYIRNKALGDPLVPYEERVDRAVKRILASRPWAAPQRTWLQRLASQIKKETVVDREALDHGAFRNEGGFTRINRVFDGHVEEILTEINEEIWKDTA